MKNSNKLTTVLYIISRLSFRICQLILICALIFELIPDGKLGNYSSTTHHSKGYPLNAQIQLNIPDTLIAYKDSSSKGFIQKTESKQFNESFYRIIKDTSFKKTFFINNFVIYGDDFKEIPKENLKPEIAHYDSEVKLILNPENYFLKSVLILKNYLSLILILFISFQFMHLFKQLRNNFSFNDLLNKRIQYIGSALLIYQALNFIASVIAMQYFSRINYYHYIPSIENSRFNYMDLIITREYNLSIIFLGLCCLVLAKLLNYGYNLQNENELTI